MAHDVNRKQRTVAKLPDCYQVETTATDRDTVQHMLSVPRLVRRKTDIQYGVCFLYKLITVWVHSTFLEFTYNTKLGKYAVILIIFPFFLICGMNNAQHTPSPINN